MDEEIEWRQVQAEVNRESGCQSDYEFAGQLFDVPLTKRYNWLRKKADEVIRTGKLSDKTEKSLNDALGYLKGKR